MKITKKELEALQLWDITFYTKDKEGNKKFWKFKNHKEHNHLCEGLKAVDLETEEEWLGLAT